MVSQNKIITSQSYLHRLWQQAKDASRSRKDALRRGDFRAAERFSAIKIAMAVRVFQLAPSTDCEAHIQWWYTNVLVSVTYAGEKLHLPYRCRRLFHLGDRELHPHSTRGGIVHGRPHVARVQSEL
jgi:hypothetical protein